MLDIPKEIKDLFLASNNRPETVKKFKLRFYEDNVDSLYPYETLFPDESLFPLEHGAPWVTIEDDRIVSESLKITESLSESENLEFGSCNASQMEIIVADVAEDLTDREFTLTVEIGGYELALGIYTVKSYVRQSDRRKRKITAYDRMEWFNVDVSEWYNDLTFPMTIKAFRDSLCRYIGIEQMPDSLVLDAMQITKTIEPKVLSGIDVMKSICQINGCFGHVDKTGVFKYIHLQQTGLYPSETLFPEDILFPAELGGDGMPVENIYYYKQPMTYEEYMIEGINGLSVRGEEGDIGANVGESTNSYSIEGNFLLYGKSSVELLNIAQSILPLISDKIYRPSKVQCSCMPWLEPGDAIRVYTNNDIIETFVMKRTMSGCQAMMDTIESTGSKRKEEKFGLNRQIIQLEGKTAVIIKNVEEVSVKISDLKNYTESQFKITSEQISAEVTRAKGAEEKLSSRITVEADRITSEVTRAKGAEENLGSRITQTATEIRTEVSNSNKNLQSQITQNAQQILLKVSKGDVSNQISVESGGVNITGNRLTWSASNSSMTDDGTLTCNNIKATNGTFSGRITGSSISGGSVYGSYFEGGEIEIGNFSVNENYIDLGDFRVSSNDYGMFFSTDNENTVQITSTNSPEWNGPHIQLKYGDYATQISHRALMTEEIILTDPWWDGWTLTEWEEWVYDQINEIKDAIGI